MVPRLLPSCRHGGRLLGLGANRRARRARLLSHGERRRGHPLRYAVQPYRRVRPLSGDRRDRPLDRLHMGREARFDPRRRGASRHCGVARRQGLSINDRLPSRSRVKVEIHDSGVGIPAEELPHIFEGFHRVPGPNEGDIGVGSGLGLAISKHILELHQSMIEATSQLNQGTTFTFPRAGEAPELWRYEGGEGVTALLIVTRKSARLGS